MTLSEAIIHCEEVADRCAVTDGNAKCEMEHRQLAEWLKELAAAEDRIRKLEEELKDERHANEVLEHLAENRELKNKVAYTDGVIYGLKYSIRCNGVSGNDIRD
jgi:coenzyme F420-reducing hydrogenase delta subunit